MEKIKTRLSTIVGKNKFGDMLHFKGFDTTDPESLSTEELERCMKWTPNFTEGQHFLAMKDARAYAEQQYHRVFSQYNVEFYSAPAVIEFSIVECKY